MPEEGAISPLAVLARLEERARDVAQALPQGSEVTAPPFIGFRLDESKLVAPMSDILEIVSYPDLSRVPGAKPWLRGISHLRGRLLSVVDLSLFLGGPPTRVRRGTRMLIVEREDLLTGLVVDEVYGMKYCLGAIDSDEAPPPVRWLGRATAGSFELEGERWRLFACERLLDDPEFLQVAA